MISKERKVIKRGEIYFFDFGKAEGSVQSGRRPVLVLQADNFNTHAPTILVASITTVIKKSYLPSHIVIGEGFGLKKPSMVLLEQIQTVNKEALTDYIGFIDDEAIWKNINIAIKKTFGLWIYDKGRTGDIRCLCPKCLRDYITSPNYIVRRVDPLTSVKESCDKCGGRGYDYVIYDKRTTLRKKGVR